MTDHPAASRPPDITLVTCRVLPEPDPDAAPLERALDEAGLSWRWAAWNDPEEDWAASPITLLRSTWDYFSDHEGFLAWAERVSAQSQLLNPVKVIRWNSHKRYLVQLAEAGVPVIPTALVPQGSEETLAAVCAARGWGRVVIKPAVSAGSWETWAVDGPAEGEAVFRRLVSKRDVLVQPFMEAVRTTGERSLIVIDGQLTHAVLKHPRFAGEEERIDGPMPVTEAQRTLARRAIQVALDACGLNTPLLYVRVDVIDGPEGPMVAEVEAVEPSLFFEMGPEALQRLISGLQHYPKQAIPERF